MIGAGSERTGVREVIAPPRPVLVILGVVGCAVVAFAFVVVSISDQGGYASFPGYMVAFAVSWTALIGVSTARIELRGDELVLVDWMTTRTVHRAAISHVKGVNGVVIVTPSGERLESVAYGRSVFQMVFPSGRYTRLAARIEERADVGVSTPATDDSTPIQESHAVSAHHRRVPVARQARKILTRGLPIMFGAAQLLGVLLWATSPVLLGVVHSL